jgi:Large extracellular alpha-helical protein
MTDIVVDVSPAHPEEGQIGGSVGVLASPARVWITAQGTVAGGNVVVTGKLSWLDMAALETALEAGRTLDDPSGKPITGGSVVAEVIHLVPVRTQTGTTYDFIEKKVVPLYDYSEERVSLGTHTLTSAADGTFRLSVPAPVAKDGYQLIVSARDPEGRTIRVDTYGTAPAPERQSPLPYLEVAGGCGYAGITTRLDTPVKLTMRQGDGSVAPAGHFLFLVGEAGSVETTVQDSATFARTLRDSDLPGFIARAVWLSNDGYAVADVAVEVDRRDKTITIKLRPDRATYQPGDPVTIAVTTTDPAGHPIAADVVVQGVDEKLYTIGAAYDSDPLDQLMARTGPGFLGDYQSHAVPMGDYGECGGTGGGGRDDFRDAITFQRITTDASGHGLVSFKLSDDLTSWHVSGIAVSAGLDAGQAHVLVPVGLPFFVDAVLAPEYLSGDLPILRLRGYGAGLAAGDHVSFLVSAPSLGLAPTVVEGSAFEPLRLALPAMVAGDHSIRIESTATHAGTTAQDVLIRTIHVVDTRIGTVAASYDALGAGFSPQGGAGLTTYVVTDAGRGRLLGVLRDLAASTSARFDKSAAAELARQILIQEFDVPAASLPATGYDATRYQADGGIALLPYASADLFLSARAALVAGTAVNVDALRTAFNAVLDAGADSTRERGIVALAGLGAIGDDVLERLRSYDPSGLTVREQLWLAIGFAASGDETTARAMERTLLEANGQRLGPWVRLAVGTSLDDTLEASGLLLLLAGRLGDPIANDVSRYLIDHPSKAWVFPLEQLGYARGMLDRLPRVAGSFAWTVDGQRHEVTLDAGGAFSLVLTAAQRASLRFEALTGDLAVTTTWTADGANLPSDPSVSVTRTVTPAGSATDAQLVHVTFKVTFGPQATAGCYRLTDFLPSGLAPVVVGAGWPNEDETATVISPYEVDGQRVAWCVSPADANHVYGYSARVVTPGTYLWEPAVVQSEVAPTIGSSTPMITYSIR